MIHEAETYKIIGVAMEVHNYLGCGYTEKVYQEALANELARQKIPFKREFPLHVNYKGDILETSFVPDFICYDKIIVELKAVQELEPYHQAQAYNYAKIANMDVALLINFGKTSLDFERFDIDNKTR